MTWIPVPDHSDFSLQNLPYGVYSAGGQPRAGVAIGDQILDLHAAATLGLFDGVNPEVFLSDTLNAFIALGKPITSSVRRAIQQALTDTHAPLKTSPRVFIDQKNATMHLPVAVGDYTDFYSSIEHATNVGKMFRDPENALLPNWRHLPVGYHGRASSIIVSDVPIYRPSGQVMPRDASTPVFQPTGRLDFELEMAFVVGKNSTLGQPIPIDKAEDYIFGLVLFNDWSARDIQQWEYVPLGPFLGKSFASSVSPWIVPLEALDLYRVAGPAQEPEVLPYLAYRGEKNFDINLEVGITPADGEETIVSRSNFKYMYWNMAQQLTHHTVNGCNVRVGDLMASGTISGKDVHSYGSMLELAWAGARPITLKDGSQRVFIHDNDTVTLRGAGEKNGVRVGFGEVRTKVLPAVLT